jgi:hypothetical protein
MIVMIMMITMMIMMMMIMIMIMMMTMVMMMMMMFIPKNYHTCDTKKISQRGPIIVNKRNNNKR